MSEEMVTCALCGHTFDPENNAACPSCPLNKGCRMVCCPACGNTNINPARSTLAGWFKKLMGENSDGMSVLEA